MNGHPFNTDSIRTFPMGVGDPALCTVIATRTAPSNAEQSRVTHITLRCCIVADDCITASERHYAARRIVPISATTNTYTAAADTTLCIMHDSSDDIVQKQGVPASDVLVR